MLLPGPDTECVSSGRPRLRFRGSGGRAGAAPAEAPGHALLGPVLDQLERDLEALPAAVRVVLDVDPGAML